MYHQDANGNVVALSGGSGSLIEKYEYLPYGGQSVYNASGVYQGKESTVGNPYMFTGRRYDDESGLYYYRARMYSAILGRFLQTDPLGYYDSMNLYQYCGNNPVNWVDPLGLAEHTNNPSPSNLPRHEKGKKRANQKNTDKKRNNKRGQGRNGNKPWTPRKFEHTPPIAPYEPTWEDIIYPWIIPMLPEWETTDAVTSVSNTVAAAGGTSVAVLLCAPLAAAAAEALVTAEGLATAGVVGVAAVNALAGDVTESSSPSSGSDSNSGSNYDKWVLPDLEDESDGRNYGPFIL